MTWVACQQHGLDSVKVLLEICCMSLLRGIETLLYYAQFNTYRI